MLDFRGFAKAIVRRDKPTLRVVLVLQHLDSARVDDRVDVDALLAPTAGGEGG